MKRKYPWKLTNKTRAAEVEKCIPLIWHFVNHLTPEIQKLLGGREEAFQAFALEAFQAVEDAKRNGCACSTAIVNRCWYVTRDLIAKNQVVRRSKYRPPKQSQKTQQQQEAKYEP